MSHVSYAVTGINVLFTGTIIFAAYRHGYRPVFRIRKRDVRRNGRHWKFYWPDEFSHGAWNLGWYRIDFGIEKKVK